MWKNQKNVEKNLATRAGFEPGPEKTFDARKVWFLHGWTIEGFFFLRRTVYFFTDEFELLSKDDRKQLIVSTLSNPQLWKQNLI